MAFGDSRKTGGTGGDTFPDSPFLYFSGNTSHIIRVLDTDEISYWAYGWQVNIGGKQVFRQLSVGMNNPIAERMRGLDKEDPKYVPLKRRFALNVLVRTPAKITAGGKAIYANSAGIFPDPKDPNRPYMGSEPAVPVNRVMIFEFGPQVLDGMVIWDQRFPDPENYSRRLLVSELDLKVTANGEGRLRKYTVLPETEHEPLPAGMTTARYDLRAMAAPIPNDALERILAGEDYEVVMKDLGRSRIAPLW